MLASLVLLASLALSAQSSLPGDYTVCLHYSAELPPSKTTMTIASADPAEGSAAVTGNFYGSPFITAKIAKRPDRTVFFATTEDASGRYIHSGELRDDQIKGQTFSEGRDFLMPWVARKGPWDCS